MSQKVSIHIWPDKSLHGFLWDVSEDHGGYDRCAPVGPFATIEGAKANAQTIFDTASLDVTTGYAPDHYPPHC